MCLDFWNKKSKKINVIVDNDSWIIEYAKLLVKELKKRGHDAVYISKYSAVNEADISFYLGCIKITPDSILSKCKKNLVVHESSLPKGKGFSPLTWQIIEGKNEIPITLLEMASIVDSGPVVYRDTMAFEGHELVNELRHIQGQKTVEICLKYVDAKAMPKGIKQEGSESFYKKRTSKDSLIDVNKSIASNFNLLRTVDNEKYPAYFNHMGHKYTLRITKEER